MMLLRRLTLTALLTLTIVEAGAQDQTPTEQAPDDTGQSSETTTESAEAVSEEENAPASTTESAAEPAVPVEQEVQPAAEIVESIPVDQAVPQVTAEDVTQLDEVVVTAQRRVESAQKAGVALDVIDGEEMSRSGTIDTRSLTQKIPALVSNGLTTFVRGVGTFSLFSYTDPAIAFNYDGIYIGRATAVSGLYFDLQRVELLKGPQGTLYGRNATGGALNIIPARPSGDSSATFANVAYGTYDAYNVEAAYNQPLTDATALRFSGQFVQMDALMNDGTSDKNLQSVRVQSLTEFDSGLLHLSGDFSHTDGIGEGRTYRGNAIYDESSGTWGFNATNFGRFEGLFSQSSQDYRSTIFSPLVGRNLEPIGAYPFQNNDNYGVHAEVNWETNIGTVTVLPAWRGYALHTGVGNTAYVELEEAGDQYTLEARLSKSDTEWLDYTLGVFGFQDDTRSDGWVNQQPIYAQQGFTTATTSGALFGRLTGHLTDTFRAVAGGRYTHDKKDFEGFADGLVLICTTSVAGVRQCPTARLLQYVDTVEQQPFIVPAPNGPPQPQPGEGTILVRQLTNTVANLSQGKVTYRGALEYDVADESMVYGSYETGYRSGGFSIAAGHETYKPEEIVAITVGSKNRFFKVLQVNLEAFDWEYSDQQLGHVGVDDAGRQNFIIDNVGTSNMRGVEIDAKAVLPTATRVGVGAQWLDSKYTDFTYVSNTRDVVPVATTDNPPPPLLGCPYTPDGNGGHTVNCSGFPAFNAPEWTVNLNLGQTIGLDNYTIVLNADTQYRTDYYIGFDYLPFQKNDGGWRTNVMATLKPFGSTFNWSLSAYVRNIEDTQILVFANTAMNTHAMSYAEPRTYGLRLTGEF